MSNFSSNIPKINLVGVIEDVKYKINETETFSDGIIKLCEKFLGSVIDDRLLRKIETEIYQYLVSYFDANPKYTFPEWKPICRKDTFASSISLHFETLAGKEIDLAEAQYRIDKFGHFLHQHEIDEINRLNVRYDK